MRTRYLAALLAGCMVLTGVTSATAATRQRTRLKLDNSAALAHGRWLYSGRVIQCASTVKLVGVRTDGSDRTLDWTLPSTHGHAWALAGKRTGFKREFVEAPKTKHCTGDKIRVFPK